MLIHVINYDRQDKEGAITREIHCVKEKEEIY